LGGKSFINNLDAYEERLFSIAPVSRDENQLQIMMGVDVTVEGGIRTRKNIFEDPLYSSTRHASRLFSLLCKYRIVDVVALLEGHHPPATLINRIIAPSSNEPLLVSNQTPLAQFFTNNNTGPLIAPIQASE
jgi:hypothetical protein